MSASNNKFELAIAVPIMNSYFRHKNRYSFVIDDRLSDDSMSITQLKTDSQSTAIDNASEVLVVGDRITLKDEDGNVDDTTISGVTTSGLLLGIDDDMTAFDDNTDVASSGVGYGDAVPGGWYLFGFDPLAVSAMTVEKDLGAFDNFSFKMHFPGIDATEYNLYLIQSINTDYYVQNLKHRIGIKTKWTVTGGFGCTSFLRVTNQTTSRGFMLYSDSDTTISSWESQTSSDIYLTESSIDYYRIYVLLKSSDRERTVGSTLYIDEVYLEHVYNPVSGKTIYGESPSITSTENCYYEMDYYDQASLKIRKIQLQTDVTMLDKSITKFDATGWGERNIKYEVTCRFTNVSTDMWDKMNEFLNIQSNGYKLNLHPYRDELPGVLTGYIYIDGIDYSNWDMSLVSFDFRFREA